MKIILGLILAVFSSSVYAQTELCRVPLKDSPVIRGLRLTMPEKDFLNAVGWQNTKTISSGYLIQGLSKTEKFQHIDSIRAKIFDKKIYEFTFDYDDGVKWKDAKEFAQNLSENLNLPFVSWRFDSVNWTGKMICDDFQISIDYYDNSITLLDLLADQKIADENEKKESDKKKGFKPK